MFSGRLLLLCLTTLFGDLFGRKMLMVGSLGLYVLGLVIAVSSFSLAVTAAGLFVAFFGLGGFFSSSYYFTAETMSTEKREKSEITFQIYFGVGFFVNVLCYWLFGNWKVILIFFYLVPAAIVFFFMASYAQDTPICLVIRYS